MPIARHLIKKMEKPPFEMFHQQLEGFAAARPGSLGELLDPKIWSGHTSHRLRILIAKLGQAPVGWIGNNGVAH